MSKSQRNPWRRRILVTILIIAIVFAGVYWFVATEKFSDTKDRRAAYTVSAFDFIDEFKKNEKASRIKYDGKIIAVSGRVSSAEPVDTTMNIKMENAATGDYIIFSFQQQHLTEAKTIKPGDSVSIKAAFSDFDHSEILDVYYITFQRSTLNK